MLIFLSKLAVHQQYLVEDPRASIFIAPAFMEADALARSYHTSAP